MTQNLIKTRKDHKELRKIINEDTGGGNGGGSVSWDDVTGKPAVIAAGADQAAARTAIGAGTSSLVLGSGANQAASGADLAALTARVVALENAAGG